MQIIVAWEKHDTRYLDASSPQAWALSSLSLLRERHAQGDYLTPDEMFPLRSDSERPLDDEALAALPIDMRADLLCRRERDQRQERERTLYARWFEKMLAAVEASEPIMLTGRSGAQVPEAWHLLQFRTEYEYERVSLERIKQPVDIDQGEPAG